MAGPLLLSAASHAGPGAPVRVTPGRSRLGDEIVYTLFERAHEHHGVDLLSPQGWSATGSQRMRLEGLERAPDRDGALRDSLVVSWEEFGTNGTPRHDAIQAVSPEPPIDRMREWIDLGTQHVWRLDAHGASPDRPGYALSFYVQAASRLSHLALQGRTFAPEEALHDLARSDVPRALEWETGYVTADDISPPPLGGATILWDVRLMRTEADALAHVSVRAGDAVEIDGRVAVSVVTSVATAVPRDTTGLVPQERWKEAFAGGVAYVEHIAWYATGDPYPLIEHERRHGAKPGGDRIVVSERSRAVAAFTPGNDLVEWISGHDEPRRFDRSPEDQYHPADGTGSRLGYPLSQALHDVEGTAAAGFLAWRAVHPKAILLTAHLSIGRDVPDSQESMWTLVWADTESGRGYEVTSERVPGQPRPAVLERGPRTLPVARSIDVALAPVAISDVERLWALTFPETASRSAPNFVHWGPWVGANPDPACRSALRLMVGEVYDAPILHVGRTNTGPCRIDSKVAWQQAVVFDTARGSMVGSYDMQFDLDHQRGRSAPATAYPSKARPLAVLASPPAANLLAAASTSLLAVLVVAYFYPLLKFTLSKALWLAPGYSKLVRHELLDHRLREQLLALIRADPGINPARLAERSRAPWGTVVHHLHVLEKNGIVFSVVDGRYRRFFGGDIQRGQEGALVALAHAATRSFYELIRREPGLSQRSLAARLGVKPPNAIWHLRRLESVGLIERKRVGRTVQYAAAQRSAPTAG